jgi:hypothetical protein
MKLDTNKILTALVTAAILGMVKMYADVRELKTQAADNLRYISYVHSQTDIPPAPASTWKR